MDGQWEAHGHWNETCRQRHEELYSLTQEIHSVIAERAEKRGGIEIIREEENWSALSPARRS